MAQRQWGSLQALPCPPRPAEGPSWALGEPLPGGGQGGQASGVPVADPVGSVETACGEGFALGRTSPGACPFLSLPLDSGPSEWSLRAAPCRACCSSQAARCRSERLKAPSPPCLGEVLQMELCLPGHN